MEGEDTLLFLRNPIVICLVIVSLIVLLAMFIKFMSKDQNKYGSRPDGDDMANYS